MGLCKLRGKETFLQHQDTQDAYSLDSRGKHVTKFIFNFVKTDSSIPR
jgi:hypothetical protein